MRNSRRLAAATVLLTIVSVVSPAGSAHAAQPSDVSTHVTGTILSANAPVAAAAAAPEGLIGLATAAITAVQALALPRAASASPSPTPAPVTTFYDNDSETSHSGTYWAWEPEATISLLYPEDPVVLNTSTADGSTAYWSYRTVLNKPLNDLQHGECFSLVGSAGMTDGPHMWWPPTGGTTCAGDGGNWYMNNCSIAVNNGYNFWDPLANVSYGTTWVEWRHNHHEWADGYLYHRNVTTPPGAPDGVSGRIIDSYWSYDRVFEVNGFKTVYGGCQYYDAPFNTDVPCMTNLSDLMWAGPTGKGIDRDVAKDKTWRGVRNGYTVGEVIPQTVYQTGGPLTLSLNGRTGTSVNTDLGQVYADRGAGLYGYGGGTEGLASIALVNDCEDAMVNLAPVFNLPSWGNYKFTYNDTIVTCSYITTPGYMLYNFRGCKNPSPEANTQWWYKYCNQTPLPGENSSLNFDPSRCTPDPNCAWNNTITGSTYSGVKAFGIPTRYQLSPVQSPYFPESNTAGVSTPVTVEADGRAAYQVTPDLNMTLVSYLSTPIPGNKWLTYEARTGSQPWSPTATDPNSGKQPFSGEVTSCAGTAANGERCMSVLDAALLTGKDALAYRAGWPASMDQLGRTLQMNFYEAGQRDGSDTFYARTNFNQNWTEAFTMSNLVAIGRSTSSYGSRTQEFLVTETCNTTWEPYKVVSARAAGGG